MTAKKVGEEKSRAKRKAPEKMLLQSSSKRSRPFWLLIGHRKPFAFFCPISEQQIPESVSCVVTQSSKQGSFVRHIAWLVYRKSKALFMENRTINVEKICADRTYCTTVLFAISVLFLMRDPGERSQPFV